MAKIIVQHKVEDFDKWKKLFDLGAPFRKMSGQSSCQIFRNSDDLNDISIVFEWDDLHKAVRFSQSEELREGMKMAGVLGDPKVYLELEAE